DPGRARRLKRRAPMRFVSTVFVVAAFAALCTACSSSPADPVFGPNPPGAPPAGPPPGSSTPPPPPPPRGPTFHKDIQPLVIGHCQQCHVPGGLAPFALLSYADAKAHARGMADQTGARTMPPWGAQKTADCQPPFGFKRDPSLTDAEIATIAAWQNAGA